MRLLPLTLAVAFLLPSVAPAQARTVFLRDAQVQVMSHFDPAHATPLATLQREFEVLRIQSVGETTWIEVRTWQNRSAWVRRDQTFETPEDAIDHYTRLILAGSNQRIPAEPLAALYKWRGIAWRESEVRAWTPTWNPQVFDIDQLPLAKPLIGLLPRIPQSGNVQSKTNAIPSFAKGGGGTIFNMAPMKATSPPPNRRTIVEPDIKDFNESLRLNPVQADAYVFRATAWLRKVPTRQPNDGDMTPMDDDQLEQLVRYLDDAIRDCDRALRIDPDFTWAFFVRGLARRKRLELDIEKANKELKKLAKEDVEAWPGWSRSLKTLKADDPAHAQKLLELKDEMDAEQRNVARAKSLTKRRTEELALEKEVWQTATSLLGKTEKDDGAAKKKQEQATLRLEDARTALATARDRLAEAEQLFERASDRWAELHVAIERRRAIADKARAFRKDFAQEMDLIRGDYNDALRRDPNAPALIEAREQAREFWKTAQKILTH